MGLIGQILGLVFGGGRNAIRETAEVFRENAEAAGQRYSADRSEVVQQFGAEFSRQGKGAFDRFMDGVNRLPRPAMALGTLGLFVAAMVDPVWFAKRMQGIALVPEPLWWLLGVIVSFYFSACHQLKAQTFQREIAQSLARVPQVVHDIQTLESHGPDSPGAANTGTHANLSVAAVRPDNNPALAAWKAKRTA